MVPAGVGGSCWPQLLEPGAGSQLLQHLHVTQTKALQEARERRVFPTMAGLCQQGRAQQHTAWPQMAERLL